MPKPEYPYVHSQLTRHGKRVYYYRRGRGPRIRLPDDPGTARFKVAYMEAANGDAMPRPRRAAKHSVVYFVRSANAIKIGVTTDLGKRIASIQTSTPYPVELIAAIPGDKALESELHATFANHRTSGEWFRLSPDIVAWLQRYFAACLKPARDQSAA